MADPGCLERGFIYIGVGFALLILSIFSLMSHENENSLFSLSPNYFIFIGYIKMGEGKQGFNQTP